MVRAHEPVERHRVSLLRRGFPIYPTNGLLPSKFEVRLVGETTWRRVYFGLEGRRATPHLKILGEVVPMDSNDADRVGFTTEGAQTLTESERDELREVFGLRLPSVATI